MERRIAQGLLGLPLLLPLLLNPAGGTVESAKAAALYLLVPLLAAGWFAQALRRSPGAASRPVDPAAGTAHLRRAALPLGLALALGAAGLLAAATSPDPLRSVLGSAYWRGGLVTMACQLGVFVLALVTLGSGRRGDDLLAALSGGSVPVAAYALLQAAGLDVMGWDVTFDGRPGSTLGSPIVLGNYLALALPVGAARLLGRGDRRLAGVVVALQAAALIATLSRGAWLAALVGLAIVAILAPAGRLRRAGLVALAAAVVLGLMLLLRADPRTGWIRLALWQETLTLVAERPLLGHGQERFGLVFPARESPELRALVGRGVLLDHAHNLWLDLSFEIGVVGVVALTALLALAIGRGIAATRRARGTDGWPASAGLVGALAAYAVGSLFMFPTVVPTTLFWLLAGTVVARPVPGRVTTTGPTRAAPAATPPAATPPAATPPADIHRRPAA